MEWYIPITILPGVGMFILSTTTQMMSLSMEIGELLSGKCTPFQHKISAMKIDQLSRLTKSATLFYLSASCFVLSGVLGAFGEIPFNEMIPEYILLMGVFLLLIPIGILVQYGLKTIIIRKLQHQHNHEM